MAPTYRGSRAISSDGHSGGLHQKGVAVALVGSQHIPEFLGHRDGDVEIAARQHLDLTAPHVSAGGTATAPARSSFPSCRGAADHWDAEDRRIPSSSTMMVPTNPQNSISVCQSRPLRAKRDASIASTAPTRPSQIAASRRSKPGRLMPPPERPRSSSMTSTAVQPSCRARSANLHIDGAGSHDCAQADRLSTDGYRRTRCGQDAQT